MASVVVVDVYNAYKLRFIYSYTDTPDDMNEIQEKESRNEGLIYIFF